MSISGRLPEPGGRRILVKKNGPYLVCGGVPLVRKTEVVSEYGEPMTWRKEGIIPTSGDYELCRCGHSGDKPFCDGTHRKIGFDGAERADASLTVERQIVHGGGARIVVRRDFSLCVNAGFCGTRLANIEELVEETGDPQVRAEVMAMIERCPSGSLTYKLAEGQPDIEPDLPQQVAVTTEITSAGTIAGPLWVTGGVPIERADGEPFETRNRVTLCCCGRSGAKPLCDGSHRR